MRIERRDANVADDTAQEDNTFPDDLKSPSFRLPFRFVCRLPRGWGVRELVQSVSLPPARCTLRHARVGDDSFRETAVKGTPVGAGIRCDNPRNEEHVPPLHTTQYISQWFSSCLRTMHRINRGYFTTRGTRHTYVAYNKFDAILFSCREKRI